MACALILRLLLLLLNILPTYGHNDPQLVGAPRKRNDKFAWAVIGGSWASGVTFDTFGATDYDSNENDCLRANYSYSSLMKGDNSWVPDQKEQDLHLAACAESTPQHIFNEIFGSHGPIQQESLGGSNLTILHPSLNDWKLAGVLNDCIFQQEDKDYKSAFPDKNGECTKALEKARSDIEGNKSSGVQHEIHVLIYSWWEYMSSKNNGGARLYVIGYADFFNTIEDATMCNNISFARNADKGQKLTMELRKEINKLVQLANDKIRNAIQIINDGDSRVKVGFVDINSSFDGSRFCEGGHSLYDQYFGNKVKFWNHVPDRVVIKRGNNYQFRVPTENERQRWVVNRSFTENKDETDTLMWSQNASTKNVTFPEPKQDGVPGIAFRAFLPNEDGHSAIADAVKERLKQDLAPPPPPPPPPPPKPEPEPEPPAPPPHKNSRALHIALQRTTKNTPRPRIFWIFYVSAIAEPGNGCNNIVHQEMQLENGVFRNAMRRPEWNMMGGEYKFQLQIPTDTGDQTRACTYFNNGENPGMLQCEGVGDIACFEETTRTDPGGIIQCEDGLDSYHPTAYCEF